MVGCPHIKRNAPEFMGQARVNAMAGDVMSCENNLHQGGTASMSDWDLHEQMGDEKGEQLTANIAHIAIEWATNILSPQAGNFSVQLPWHTKCMPQVDASIPLQGSNEGSAPAPDYSGDSHLIAPYLAAAKPHTTDTDTDTEPLVMARTMDKAKDLVHQLQQSQDHQCLRGQELRCTSVSKCAVPVNSCARKNDQSRMGNGNGMRPAPERNTDLNTELGGVDLQSDRESTVGAPAPVESDATGTVAAQAATARSDEVAPLESDRAQLELRGDEPLRRLPECPEVLVPLQREEDLE